MDSNWSLMKDGLPETPTTHDWLCNHVESGGGGVGADPMLMTSTAWASLADKLEAAGGQLVAVDKNLVDAVWSKDKDDPQLSRPDNEVFPLGMRQ